MQAIEGYKPHIIFVDVLLKRKDGYEVSREIHQNFGQIPVVLMRSEFVELDQKKYKSCGAKAELEKPFHVKEMRKLVTSLVKEVQSPKISKFLDFPEGMKRDLKQKPPEGSNGQRDGIHPHKKASPSLQSQTSRTEKPVTSWDAYSHDDLFPSNEDSSKGETSLDFQPMDLQEDKESDPQGETSDFQLLNTDPKNNEKPESGDINFQSLDISSKSDEKSESNDLFFQLDQTPPPKQDTPNEKEDPKNWSTDSSSDEELSDWEIAPPEAQDSKKDLSENFKSMDLFPNKQSSPQNTQSHDDLFPSNEDSSKGETSLDFQPMDLQEDKESDPQGETSDFQLLNTDPKNNEKPEFGDINFQSLDIGSKSDEKSDSGDDEKSEPGDIDFQSLDISSKSDEKSESNDLFFQLDQTPPPKENSQPSIKRYVSEDQTPPPKQDTPNEKEDPKNWSTDSSSDEELSDWEIAPPKAQDSKKDLSENFKSMDLFPNKQSPPQNTQSHDDSFPSNEDSSEGETSLDFQPMDLQEDKESDPQGETSDFQLLNTDPKNNEKPESGDINFQSLDIGSKSDEKSDSGDDEKSEPGDIDFQSLDISSKSDEKPKLDDFLFQPDETPPPKQDSSDGKPSDSPQSPLDKNKMEQIVRMETHSLLQKIVSENLPRIMEKLVREELQKILEQEMALKKDYTQKKEET